MAGNAARGVGATAKQLARGVLGAVSPRLLTKVQIARAHARYQRAPMRGPRRLQLETSTACNYRCIMCLDHSPLLSSHVAAQVMPWEQVERLLREAAAMGAEEVWFAGRGEPLVHPQATQIVALASSLGLRTMITTNGGRLTEAVADELCEAGLTQLSVSINSGCPATYAHIHGAPAEERARVLAVMKHISRRPRRPWLFASMVVQRPNAQEVGAFVDDAIEAGAGTVGLLGLLAADWFPTLVLEDMEAIQPAVEAARARAEQAGVHLELHNIPDPRAQARQAEPEPKPAHWRLGCFVGYQFTRIDVDGDLHSCCGCTNHLGTIAGGSFAEAWLSPAYQEFRQQGRDMPTTGRPPAECNCAMCGNTMDNEVAHREMGLR